MIQILNWKTGGVIFEGNYPNLEMVVNDLYEKGLLEEGTYEIDIDW